MKLLNDSEGKCKALNDGSSGAYISNASKTNPLKQINKLCCIGAGYVGGTTCAVIAHKAPEILCTVVDINKELIAAWNSDNLPIFEPSLDEIVKIARDGDGAARKPNLFFSSEIGPAIAAADAIFISVGTPTKTSGLGAGSASDLRAIESAARSIATNAVEGYKIIVEKSTVPCKTAETIKDIIVANTGRNFSFDILSNPEFLAEGTAMLDLLHPDRVLIGSLRQQNSSLSAARSLAEVYARWVPRERIIFMNLWSSELAKLAANAFLAQRISSINALSAICEVTGANVSEVSHAVSLDNRIGPKMLQPSVGFGGSCFKKDILNLVYLSESLNLPQVAAYWRSIIEINEWQKERFTQLIVERLYGSLSQKRIAILGFAYKKNTADTRESASISVVNNLVAEGAWLSIYDPHVPECNIFEMLRKHCSVSQPLIEQNVSVHCSPYEACEKAHAVVIMTDWDEFRSSTIDHSTPTRASRSTLDWEIIAKQMRRPMSVFDGRNVVDVKELEDIGFRVYSIGHGDFSPFGQETGEDRTDCG